MGEFRVPRCRKWGLVEIIAQSTFSPQSGHIPSLSHLPTPSPHPALPHSRSSNTGVHGCGGGERHCLATLGIHRLREAITHLSEASGGGTRIATPPPPQDSISLGKWELRGKHGWGGSGSSGGSGVGKGENQWECPEPEGGSLGGGRKAGRLWETRRAEQRPCVWCGLCPWWGWVAPLEGLPSSAKGLGKRHPSGAQLTCTQGLRSARERRRQRYLEARWRAGARTAQRCRGRCPGGTCGSAASLARGSRTPP